MYELHMPQTPPFLDRHDEMNALEATRKGGRGGLVVVLGRRRIGKTELLARFCKGKPSTMVFVREAELSAQVADISREIAAAMGDEVVARNPPTDVDTLLELIARFLSQAGNPVLVLDEFQNLVGGRRDLQSAFQAAWDIRLRKTGGVLVLCGSAVGMMEEITASPRAPLYGRSTVRLHLQPLAFWNCGPMLPEAAWAQKLLRFAVAGGVPHFLQVMASHKNLRKALLAAVFQRTAPLYDEPATMIRAETREPDRYFTLLEAIAGGASRPTDIADRARIPVTQVTAYLKILTEGLRLVERRTPITARRGVDKVSLYRLADPFYRFWFACVAPQKSLLERGAAESAVEAALERLPTLAGPVLEDIVMDAMAASHGAKWEGLRLDFTSIGSWWSRRGDEVDILGLGGKGGPIAVEVTLGGRPVDRSDVDRLVAKLPLLPVKGPIRPAILTLGRFTPAALERGKEVGVALVGGNTLASVFRGLQAL